MLSFNDATLLVLGGSIVVLVIVAVDTFRNYRDRKREMKRAEAAEYNREAERLKHRWARENGYVQLSTIETDPVDVADEVEIEAETVADSQWDHAIAKLDAMRSEYRTVIEWIRDNVASENGTVTMSLWSLVLLLIQFAETVTSQLSNKDNDVVKALQNRVSNLKKENDKLRNKLASDKGEKSEKSDKNQPKNNGQRKTFA